MNVNSYLSNSKLLIDQKELLVLETKHILKNIPKIDWNKIDILKNKISNYKITINLLYTYPDFYYELKNTQLDFTRTSCEFDFLEIIWMKEHYEFMEKNKSISSDIFELIKFALKFNIVSHFQYKYMKKTLCKIDKIFEYDKCFEKLYQTKQDISSIINSEEIDLFFDLLEIIIQRIDMMKKYIKKKIKIKSNSTNLTANNKYTKLIKKIKFNIQKK